MDDSLSGAVRILVDYRPALRQRTGVGEFVHELVRALARRGTDEVAIFTSSWRDRPPTHLSANLGARVIDRRIPVALLNALWHRVGWPPVEWLAGRADVVHAAHPLLIPARQAAQVVTIHDLFFLTDPTGMSAEIRRDYPRLAGVHARAAHAVITSSSYGRQQVIDRLSVDPDRVYVVSPGTPAWQRLGREPNVPADGYVLFLGTLERRKNVGTLLDAWEKVVARVTPRPRLVLAGKPTAAAGPWLTRLSDPALAATVEHRGWVSDDQRESLYAGARALVLPSLEEGFGLPVLEAMSAGIPVVASRRGAIPEVTAGAAELVDPLDGEALASALVRLLTDPVCARDLATRGLERAASFTWERAAQSATLAYHDAVARHRREGGRS